MWWRVLLDFFFPPFCIVCAAALPKIEMRICGRCRRRARRERGVPFRISPGGLLPESGAGCYGRCAYTWNDCLETLLHRFKYGGFRSVGRFLGDGIVEAVRCDPALGRADLIVPVPLTRAKRRERGFNQAAVLARILAEAKGWECDERVVRRRGRSRSQTKLTPRERRENVRGVFRVVLPDRVRQRRILIVDDVVTTGATSGELARALLAAGAAEVAVTAAVQALGRRHG